MRERGNEMMPSFHLLPLRVNFYISLLVEREFADHFQPLTDTGRYSITTYFFSLISIYCHTETSFRRSNRPLSTSETPAFFEHDHIS